jgi:aldose sugar dehydrogenase
LTSIILLTGIGIGITATAIVLLFILMTDTILKNGERGPKLSDPYKQYMGIETVAGGLSFPTSMDFVDNENILVLEKNLGTIRLISLSNSSLQEGTVLVMAVDNEAERGLLGIATLKDIINDKNRYMDDSTTTKPAKNETKVFLYLMEKLDTNGQPLVRNRVHSYEWDTRDTNLINSSLILDLPAETGPYHQGGKLKIGPDNNLYAVIGDLNTIMGQLQNHKHGTEPNNSSVILRVNLDNGSPVEDNPFVNIDGLSRYYAYGIRNSFGIDFDPVTGNLWDTENGEEYYDEVNLVKPGFNSGWAKMMGPFNRNNLTDGESLVIIPGSEYADPAFSWKEQVGVTDIEFFNSPRLGTEYTNDIFVGDINNGNLYYFKSVGIGQVYILLEGKTRMNMITETTYKQVYNKILLQIIKMNYLK